MSKDPALLFYPSDFLTGTMFLSDEQCGKYIRLLCSQFIHGRLRKDYMIKICGTYDEDIFSKFKKESEGLYFNQRLEDEQNKRKAYSESRRKNRLKKSSNKNIISKTYDKHMENINENINKNDIEVYPSFDDFWNLYDKKVNKPKCQIKWRKLRQKDRETIMNHLPSYLSSTPDKSYRKNPLTYLNNSSWEDEIINKKNTNDINTAFAREIITGLQS